jgi:O-antigen ligase
MHAPDFRFNRGNMSESRPFRPVLLLLFGVTLVYAVLFLGIAVAQEHIENRQRRDLFTLAIALLGIASAFLWSQSRRRESRFLTWAALGLPCYALLQMIPLPVQLVGLLSPARGELLRSLEPIFGHQSFASLSIAPSETFPHVLLIATYCIIFLSIRQLTRGAGDKVWFIALPVIAAAALEAALGIAQFVVHGDVEPRGTFGLRNHLAGLLEMALPLAALYGVATLRAARRGRNSAQGMARAFAAFAVAALILAGALVTNSRGGFASVLISGLAIFGLTLGREMAPLKRLAYAGVFLSAVVMGLFFLTPESMIERLSQHSSEGRVALWRESLGVIREYPLVGCGLGGFESAFQKFKASEGIFLVDYAHNDYIQYLAELGIAGFVLAAGLISLMVKRSVEIAQDASEVRWLGLACFGSIVAILVHSFVDFNLYVPANAAVLAWICGIAAGLSPSVPRIVRRGEANE